MLIQLTRFHPKVVRLDFQTFIVKNFVLALTLFPSQSGSIRLSDSPLYGVSGGVPPYPQNQPTYFEIISGEGASLF